MKTIMLIEEVNQIPDDVKQQKKRYWPKPITFYINSNLIYEIKYYRQSHRYLEN